MKILVINGPNLNMLGIREKEIYGSETYTDLVGFIQAKAREMGVDCVLVAAGHHDKARLLQCGVPVVQDLFEAAALLEVAL